MVERRRERPSGYLGGLVDRELDVDTVRSEWHASRTRMLEAFGALDEITTDADDWFEESGPSHYAEHMPDLEQWVTRMRSER